MRRGRLFRGWYIVGAVHVLLALIFGAAYSFGAFFASIQTQFGASSFSTASIFSLTALIYYGVGVFSGAWSDRTSVRTVTSAGIVLLALGFVASSLLSSSPVLFLGAFCILVGLGVGLVYVPAVSTIARWFVLWRSSASGIALAGTGLGTLLGPVVAGALMEHLSWQLTMQVYAAAIALTGLAAAAVLRGRPEELGLHPDGVPPSGDPAAGQSAQGMDLAQAARQARFWWYFAAIFLGSIGLFLALIHINPLARQQGLSVAQANGLIGLIGVGNVLGAPCAGPAGRQDGGAAFSAGAHRVPGSAVRAVGHGARLRGTGRFRAGVRRGQRRLHRAVSGCRRDLVRHAEPGCHPGGALCGGRHCCRGWGQPGRLAVRCLGWLYAIHPAGGWQCRAVGSCGVACRMRRA